MIIRREAPAMLTEKELPVINAALGRGSDVRIQNTRDGIRIIEDKMTVLFRGKADSAAPITQKK